MNKTIKFLRNKNVLLDGEVLLRPVTNTNKHKVFYKIKDKYYEETQTKQSKSKIPHKR